MKRFIVLLGFIVTGNLLFPQEYTILHGGLERTYRLFVPSVKNTETALPLLINMHGAGSNAMEQEYYSDFNLVADTAGFIVAYPNAINGLWNIYSGGSPDDVGFIAALIDTISNKYSIDPRRIYATGMSMGGFMCYKLACHLSNKIAAIGSVAGLMTELQCAPGRAFPVCQIHGTADSTVLYKYVPLTINFWKGLNECKDSMVVDLPDIDTTDQSTVTLTTYESCNGDSEVRLYTVNGGGHSWPGASYIIDITNQDIQANVEIWKFLRRFKLPEGAGIGEIPSAGLLSVYPNPVTDGAVIEIKGLKEQNWRFSLYDVSGRAVRREENVSGNKIPFLRSGLINGIYILELSSRNSVLQKKIIIE